MGYDFPGIALSVPTSAQPACDYPAAMESETLMKRLLPGVLTATCLFFVSGCSSLPQDAADSYNNAAGGSLRVGVSPHAPWTVVDSLTGEVSGTEAALVRDFADEMGAQVDFHIAPESVLAEMISNRDLDVVIGGLSNDAGWDDKMAFTRPYETVTGADGKDEKKVMAVGLGENKMLVELERFLSKQTGEI